MNCQEKNQPKTEHICNSSSIGQNDRPVCKKIRNTNSYSLWQIGSRCIQRCISKSVELCFFCIDMLVYLSPDIPQRHMFLGGKIRNQTTVKGSSIRKKIITSVSFRSQIPSGNFIASQEMAVFIRRIKCRNRSQSTDAHEKINNGKQHFCPDFFLFQKCKDYQHHCCCRCYDHKNKSFWKWSGNNTVRKYLCPIFSACHPCCHSGITLCSIQNNP